MPQASLIRVRPRLVAWAISTLKVLRLRSTDSGVYRYVAGSACPCRCHSAGSRRPHPAGRSRIGRPRPAGSGTGRCGSRRSSAWLVERRPTEARNRRRSAASIDRHAAGRGALPPQVVGHQPQMIAAGLLPPTVAPPPPEPLQLVLRKHPGRYRPLTPTSTSCSSGSTRPRAPGRPVAPGSRGRTRRHVSRTCPASSQKQLSACGSTGTGDACGGVHDGQAHVAAAVVLRTDPFVPVVRRLPPGSVLDAIEKCLLLVGRLVPSRRPGSGSRSSVGRTRSPLVRPAAYLVVLLGVVVGGSCRQQRWRHEFPPDCRGRDHGAYRCLC